ncbi:MAG: hypothetical protein Q4A64_01660 [Porphyromonadaceae bacterium]|nr:hypothetical protein [Porphyromonadaceae bacterium]
MLTHILRIIRNERKQNMALWLELLLVFCVLWTLVDGFYVSYNLYNRPLGYETEHTYKFNLGYLSQPDTTLTQEDQGEYLSKILDLVKQYPPVEYASLSLHSSPHIGSNRSNRMYINDSVGLDLLNRSITPDFIHVFRYNNHQQDKGRGALVAALERGEILLGLSAARKLWGEGNELQAIGKKLYTSPTDSSEYYTVGGITETVRYDNFSSWTTYFAAPLPQAALVYWAGEEAQFLEFCLRVKPEEDHDFIKRFRAEMSDKLKLGNYYLADVSYIPENKKLYQRDHVNELKTKVIIALFLLVNIFLGVVGVFWFRTQLRRGEIGLRISLGDTPRGILSKYYTEGLLLLTLAMIPALVIFYAMWHFEIIPEYYLEFSLLRYCIGLVITYLLMVLMIIGGIWFPARRAIRVSPAEALRDE